MQDKQNTNVNIFSEQGFKTSNIPLVNENSIPKALKGIKNELCDWSQY